MPAVKRTSIRDLAHKIKGIGEPKPRFAFFLGAGASRQSGIITAPEMIRFFKERIFTVHCPHLRTDSEREKWLKEQEWYQQLGSEYSKLFEKFEPKQLGRQLYIESIVEGRKPSFGYVVLANLVARGYVNTIVTTNFDDLVYSACTRYVDIRPLLFSYGLPVSEMRLSVRQPRILKLHGDYLYTKLVNAPDEASTTDPNMRAEMLQVVNEYGLIVVGYSGGDNSVMDILDSIPIRNDLYWCIHRNSEPGDRANQLLSAKGGFLIEIEGFDEMMSEICGIVGFDANVMIGSVRMRQDQIIEDLKSFASTYSVEILTKTADALAEQTKGQTAEIAKAQSLDLFAQAIRAKSAGQNQDAEASFRKAIDLNPLDVYSRIFLGELLEQESSGADQAEKLYRDSIRIDPTNIAAYHRLGSLLRRDPARAAKAEEVYRQAIAANPEDSFSYGLLGDLVAEDELRAAEAEALYRKAIEIDPADTYGYLGLGSLLEKEPTRVVEAERVYRQAIATNPDESYAYVDLAYLLEKDPQRIAEAEALYRRALEIDVKSYTAYDGLGRLLEKDPRRTAEAEALYRLQIEASPKLFSGYRELGELLEKDPARNAEAEAVYRQAIELIPQRASPYCTLADLISQDPARAAEAEALYRKAIEREPRYTFAYLGLAALLAKDPTRSAEAKELYRHGTELSPNLPKLGDSGAVSVQA